MDIVEIKNELRHGDYQTIADATGYSPVTVKKIFNGARSVNEGNKIILEAAEAIIQFRASLPVKLYYSEPA